MASLLRMPSPAAGVQDAVLLDWSVDEHAAFAASDVLAVIETDKAVIDIEADSDGVLHRRLVPAGQRVDVGTPIAVIGTASDSAEEIAAMVSRAGAEEPVGTGSTEEAAGDAASDDGATGDGATGVAASSDGETGVAVSGDGANGDGAAGDRATGDGATGDRATGDRATGDGAAAAGHRIFASPIARRMAKEAGLGLPELTGTGPGGRIVRRDVLAALAARSQEPAAAAPAAPAAPVPAEDTGRGFTDIPHSRIRSAIAARLTESKASVPHFYLRATPRVEGLLALRAELNSGGEQRISVNDLVVRAVARAHRVVPEMNVTYSETATRRYQHVDVAIAIATDDGLLTPVIRDADRRPITAIAAATADLAQRARHGRLRQHELEGGSITVTNLGMFGVQEFAAIINPPQSAILAVGEAGREPVVAEDGTLTVGTVMHLVLSVDHRPLDGVVAARWLAALTDLLAHPARILA